MCVCVCVCVDKVGGMDRQEDKRGESKKERTVWLLTAGEQKQKLD